MSLHRDFKYEWLIWQVKYINLFNFFFFTALSQNMNGCIDRSKILIFLAFFCTVLSQNVFIQDQGSLMKFHFFHLCPISSHCRFFFSAQSSCKNINYALCTGNMSLFLFFILLGERKWFVWFVSAVPWFCWAVFAGSSFAFCWVWPSSWLNFVRVFSALSGRQQSPEQVPSRTRTSLLPLLLSMPDHLTFCFPVACSDWASYEFVWVMLCFSPWDCCLFVLT